MLNRIAAGAAITALPWGGFIAFAIADMGCLAITCLALTAIALVWMFAPYIPVLRGWLPAVRKIEQLEVFWAEGSRLRHQRVPDLEAACREDAAWAEKVREWIESAISHVDAEAFRVASATVNHHSTNTSQDLRIQGLEGKMEYLLSLRADQWRRIH